MPSLNIAELHLSASAISAFDGGRGCDLGCGFAPFHHLQIRSPTPSPADALPPASTSAPRCSSGALTLQEEVTASLQSQRIRRCGV